MKRQTLVAGISVFALLIVVGGGLAWWKKRSIALAAANAPHYEPMESVQVATVGKTKWRPTAELVGTALATRSVMVSNELAGRIDQVQFESGSIVEEGAVLLTIDSSTDRADLEAAQAGVRVAEANIPVVESRIALAESDTARLVKSVEARASSASELDRAQSELRSAKAELDRTKAQVLEMKAREMQVRTLLNKKTIRAPFKSRAGLRNVHPGQYLAEGTNLVQLESVDDQIFVDFAIPQERLANVVEGTTVLAQSPTLGEGTVELRVVAIDATVNTSTRNVRVRTVMPNKDGRVRPGMSVAVVVPVDAEQEYLTIPVSAVRRASYGDHAFVIVPGEAPNSLRAKQRFIKLGPSLGTEIIVLSGLEAGEQVATTGAFKLREGVLVMKVDPNAAPTPPAPPAAAK